MNQFIKKISILALLSFSFLLSSNTIVHAEDVIKNDDYFKELKTEYIKEGKDVKELKEMSLKISEKENLSEDEKKEVLMYNELIDELEGESMGFNSAFLLILGFVAFLVMLVFSVQPSAREI